MIATSKSLVSIVGGVLVMGSTAAGFIVYSTSKSLVLMGGGVGRVMGVVGGVLGVACCSGEGQEQHSTGSATSVATATDPPIIGGATASSVATVATDPPIIGGATASSVATVATADAFIVGGSTTSVATATDPPIIGGATASSVTTAVLTESAIAEAMAEARVVVSKRKESKSFIVGQCVFDFDLSKIVTKSSCAANNVVK